MTLLAPDIVEAILDGRRSGRLSGGTLRLRASEQGRQGDTNGLDHCSGTAGRLIAQHEATSLLVDGGLDDAVEVGDDVLPLEIQFSRLQPVCNSLRSTSARKEVNRWPRIAASLA